MKQALLILAAGLTLTLGGYELWAQHNQIQDLRSQIKLDKTTLSAQVDALKKTQKVLNSNQRTLNYNQQQLAKALNEIIKSLSSPDTSFSRNRL